MKQTGRSIRKRLALGTLVSLVIYPVLLAFFALLLEQGRVGDRQTTQFVMLCACTASFAGAKTAAHGMTKPLFAAMICIGTVYCVSVLLGFLINDSLNARRAAEFAGAMVVGGGCAVLLRFGKRSGRRARRMKK